jgi:hypothetical protein
LLREGVVETETNEEQRSADGLKPHSV